MRHAVIVAAVAAMSCDAPAPRAGAQPESISLRVTPVALDPHDASRQKVGSFAFAGGIEIRDAAARAILELSDLRVVSDDHLIAIGDHGSFFEARLLFDESGRLSGLTDARLIPLRDEHGRLLNSAEADAEGLDLLPDGDRLVSFEGNPRIWRYPVDGSVPRPVPSPDVVFPANEGMEALAYYPAAGRGAYLVGVEGGSIWLCHLDAACTQTDLGRLVPRGYGLTALAAYGEDGAFAMLARSWEPSRGNAISLKLIDASGAAAGRVLDEMTIAPPLTAENFEGVAVVPRATGIRLYILSDDNGSAAQRTYLFAFDWPAGNARVER